MALHQYIGARYVPIFYQNSLDPTSTEWEPNVSYEPLVIVTLPNLHSYVSKKYVPDSIGSPALNAEYWYDQGYANAYIQALQDQIDDMKDGTIPGSLQNQLNDVSETLSHMSQSLWHNKKVVVYGDSLSTQTYNYWQYMVAKDPTIQLTNRAVAGERIQDGWARIQLAADLADFDIVVLAYGTNNWSGGAVRTMVYTFKQCFAYINTQAPLAQIVCIAPYYQYIPSHGLSGTNALGFTLEDFCTHITYICNMFGGLAFNLYELAGVNQYNYTSYLEESSGGRFLHEKEVLGRKIADILLRVSPTTTPLNSYTFIPSASDPDIGLYVIKMQNLTIITEKGTLSVADLQAIDLNHLAPLGACNGFGRGRSNATMCYVSLSENGTWNLSWAGTAENYIQGLQLIGIHGTYQAG